MSTNVASHRVSVLAARSWASLRFGWMTMGQLLTLPMIVGGLALVACSRSRRSGYEVDPH